MSTILEGEQVELFDHWEYVKNIKKLLKEHFDELNTVSFCPFDDSVTTLWHDLALPAFLMSYESIAPNYSMGLPARKFEDGTFYMPATVKFVGDLILPQFPERNADVPNENISILIADAASNVASLIFSHATGWHSSLPVLDEIEFSNMTDTDDAEESGYAVATLRWSHNVYLGKNPTVQTYQINSLFSVILGKQDVEWTAAELEEGQSAKVSENDLRGLKHRG